MIPAEINIQKSINRLIWICDHLPGKIKRITDEEFSYKPGPHKWSKKEIIGHLLDSATNNHHRLIRAQFEENPLITYDQDKWNAANFYQWSDPAQLLDMWELYNRRLAEVATLMPEEMWERKVQTRAGQEPVTLAFVISDYVLHLEHHLKDLIPY